MPGGYGAAAAFPKTATNVDEWLTAIGMERYSSAFAEAGVDVAQLRQMSNTRLKELVPIEGHKRRMMLAIAELQPDSAAARPSAAAEASHDKPKYNSTSSLYIDSTISRPCIDEIIFCVSIVIHDRIEEGEREVRASAETTPLPPVSRRAGEHALC